MEYIVFTDSYFNNKQIVNSKDDVVKLINNNPNNHIRIQTKDFRILLNPEINKKRTIDGFTNLISCFELLNDRSIKQDCYLQYFGNGDIRYYNITK